jgi:hypothetical protein
MIMAKRILAGEFKAKCLKLLDEVHRQRRETVVTKRRQASGSPCSSRRGYRTSSDE